jgi:hypothetical protein
MLVVSSTANSVRIAATGSYNHFTRVVTRARGRQGNPYLARATPGTAKSIFHSCASRGNGHRHPSLRIIVPHALAG